LAERFTKQPALDLRRSHDEGQADRGEYRRATGVAAARYIRTSSLSHRTASPFIYARQIAHLLVVTKNTIRYQISCSFVYYFTAMLWFSGTTKQSVVLNSQAFIDATKYIPAQVSGTFAV
jgi:hypothetical protein